uniref:Uncharacterized protein n=1 Tax=Heterorhabditis bacteriophora TaxID=37862 RepID=A0A1I7X2I1_HETBA
MSQDVIEHRISNVLPPSTPVEASRFSWQFSCIRFMSLTVSLRSPSSSTVPLANVERSGKERREVSLAESLDELSRLLVAVVLVLATK